MWWYGYAAGLMGGIGLGVMAFTFMHDRLAFKHARMREEHMRNLDWMLQSLGPPTGPGGGTGRYGPSHGLPDGTRVATYRPRTKLTVVKGGKEGE